MKKFFSSLKGSKIAAVGSKAMPVIGGENTSPRCQCCQRPVI